MEQDHSIHNFKIFLLLLSTHIHTYRSLVQIKSHAQKVIKRQEAGEDIFQKLEDAGPQFIDNLVIQASREREALRAAGVNVNTTKPSKSLVDAAKKTTKSPKSLGSVHKISKTKPQAIGDEAGTDGGSGAAGGPESVIAAAALCQLSSVGAQQQWDQLDPLDVMPMIDQNANI
jgi:hypothetical protein